MARWSAWGHSDRRATIRVERGACRNPPPNSAHLRRVPLRHICYIINPGTRAVNFRWNHWNEQHIGVHRVEPDEAEQVLLGAKPPFPLAKDDEKYLVWGPTEAGRLLQIVFVIDP